MKFFQRFHLDKRFASHPKQYCLQSLYATLSIFIVLLLLELEHVVIIASIGASVFIVFAMPKSPTASPRRLIGGHAVGIFVGSLFALIPHASLLSSAAIYALAVGSAIFLMVVTNTDHPPAAATALGVAIIGFSFSVLFSVLTSAIVLALIYKYFQLSLADLV